MTKATEQNSKLLSEIGENYLTATQVVPKITKLLLNFSQNQHNCKNAAGRGYKYVSTWSICYKRL